MQFRDFFPVSTNTSVKESCYGALGAFVGLLGTALLCRWGMGLEVHWLIAPMGASAVLLFAAPASPLAQPWSIVVGNGVSALMGVLSASLVADPALAAALAVMLAIAAMFLTRSLHPPGGAVALTAVIGGEGIRQLGVGYVLLPVLLNSLLLLLLALCYNRLLGRRYPNSGQAQPNRHQTADPQPSERVATQAADIDFALEKHGELLDISRQDLQALLQEAQLHALRARVGTVRVQEVMSRDLILIEAPQPAMAAWQLLSHHQVKALPVVDEAGRLTGIITLHDLMIDRALQQPRGAADLAELRVADLMTRNVSTARRYQPLYDLVGAFSDGGLHHMPVVDGEQLVGILTQSDMVAALFNLALHPAQGEIGAPVSP
ncbi:TPA: HPP family protein [Aeromonas hydrophila]|uniref:HPP family protein n=1 Tax=Aeromonas hydrophila TaxID=644 RepID=UPI00002C4976|nr:HPP family protein [Aeromonas hydrophila]HAT2489981.1 HPP family protein [Aeromonas hydrophila]HAT2494537.1 HPP family protein [Aeromonas hydrophila]HAT2510182.1 HPP family protein [Aeromonas hydrophila]HAT2530631.1 HPP family protein [Aeromonas hydrophila]